VKSCYVRHRLAVASDQAQMRHLPALFAALLLPVAQPLILGTTFTTGSLLVYPAPALAQNEEAVAKVAQAITVRVEGATQGSGVLVKRDGNRYTVLTAWHVVSGQRPGEELYIFTPERQKHKLEQGSIKRLGEVDMAVLIFSSPNSYAVAKVGDIKGVISGDPVSVAGFPLGSNGLFKLETGRVVANASVGIDQGYQLLYNNDTVAGMSGGVVLKSDGTLIGMHGRGIQNEVASQNFRAIIKTGTNQGIPISYYSLFDAGSPVVTTSTKSTTADDYIAQAMAIQGKKGSENEAIMLSNQVLAIRQSDVAYMIRARAKDGLGEKQGAIADYNQAIAINPQNASAYSNRAIIKNGLGDKQGAIADYNQAIAINPRNWVFFVNRGITKYELRDNKGAIADWSQVISLNPQLAAVYSDRGSSKSELGDKQGAIADYNQAIAINPREGRFYNNRGIARRDLGDKQAAIADFNLAIDFNPQYAEPYYNRGVIKHVLGDKQGAISDFNQAIAINPREAGIYDSRGMTKADLGNKQGAIADFNQAIAIDPQFAKAYNNRGAAKYDLGDKQGAIADYDQAIAINPQYVYVYINRGNAKSALGDKIEACGDYKKAISLGAQWLKSDSGAWCRDMP